MQVVFVSVAVGVVTIVASLWYGSISAAVATAKGYSLYCENPDEQVGDIPAGGAGTSTFRFRNLSDSPITIAGAETSCSCVTLSEFPMVVDANSVASVDMTLYAYESDVGHDLSGECVLFLDVSNPEIVCRISGHAVPAEREVAAP